MKRKTIKFNSMMLTLIYSILIVVVIAITGLCVVYQLSSEKLDIVANIVKPICQPILQFGFIPAMIILSLAIIMIFAMIILSIESAKISKLEVREYLEKESLVSFFMLLNFVVFEFLGLFAYFIIAKDKHLSGLSLIIVALAVIVFVLAFTLGIDISREQTLEGNIVSNIHKSKKEVVIKTLFPSIYTKGLNDEDEKVETKDEKKTKKESVAKVKIPKKDEKLFGDLIKLDNLKKEGLISQKQYIKMRTRIIKKHTK